MQRTQLTQHFTLEELTRSHLASALRLQNQPTGETMGNLFALACRLEEVRTLLGDHPIYVLSGYRNEALNRAAGGANNSSHCYGLAADFIVPDFGSAFDVCCAINESEIAFDQLIFEQGNTEWVHLGIGERMRRQTLSWQLEIGYVNGIQKLTGDRG